ncbi:MAG: hypothetical protein H7338_05090 [Candidatus Sericytochromatia bacterium]|nr:hypothetical protein [Candidatus Sericytochromatia bacterium]
MAINPNGVQPGYYPPPGQYPQQGTPQAYGAQQMGPSYGSDMYGGQQAPPPGSGMQGAMGGMGGGLGSIFGVVGGLLNSIMSLVSSVVTGVINLVMSVVSAIFKPILGLFGIGGDKKAKPQGGGQGGAPGGVAPQAPLFNQSHETLIQKANGTLEQYRAIVQQAQANQQDAKTVDWFALMKKAENDFQRQKQELAQTFGPTAQQVAAYDGATQQVMSDLQALASANPASAAKTTGTTPGDLSSLQLPNDPNLLQLVRNLQLLMACPAQAGTLTVTERAEVDTAATQMQGQIAGLRATNPQLADQLTGFFNKFLTDWTTAKAGTPAAATSAQAPAAANTQAAAVGTGRKYRDVPLDLPGDAPTPKPKTKTPVPANLGGE